MKHALLPGGLVLALLAVSTPTPSGAVGAKSPEPTVVKGLSRVVSVAAGRDHALALRSDRSVWAWGTNAHGQLGHSAVAEFTPPAPVAGLRDVVMVAAGTGYSLALTADGLAWSWGANHRGQLGAGSTQPSSLPVQVSDLSDLVAISAGTDHALALRHDGAVFTWGGNDAGQLADGTNWPSAAPVPVRDLPRIVAISAGGRHSLAVDASGHVWSWGGARALPDRIAGLRDVVAVAAGISHSAALTADGAIWLWAEARGIGERRARPSRLSGIDGAAAVAAGGDTLIVGRTGTVWTARGGSAAQVKALSGALAGASGGSHFAVTFDGRVWTWSGPADAPPAASRPDGELVVLAPPSDQVATPTLSPGTSTQFAPVSVTVSCATSGAVIHYTTNGVDPTEADPVVTSGGTVLVQQTLTLKAKAWAVGKTPSNVASATYTLKVATPSFSPPGGTYTSAQTVTISTTTAGAEIRYTTNGSVPTAASTLYTGPVSVLSTTTLRALGLKAGWTNSDVSPSAIYTINHGLLAAGADHSLALRTDGTAWTWGSNSEAQLGPGSTGPLRTIAGQVTGLTGLKDIAGGGAYTLILKADQTVWGWGRNAEGELGDRSTIQRTDPVQAYRFTGGTAVAAGDRHSIALKSDKTVWTWGYNANGQLGDGSRTTKTAPAKISSLAGITAIAAGHDHSLALKDTGVVFAWGSNLLGQIGNGSSGGDQLTPLQVPNLTDVVAIAAGDFHSIAVKTDGSVWSWGLNRFGQLGNQSLGDSSVPVQAQGLTNVRSVKAGIEFSLALTGSGAVWSWGRNDVGQLGKGTTGGTNNVPAQITGLVDIVAIAAGGRHALALAAGGVAWAWGFNGSGQVGDGTQVTRLSPVPISDVGLAWKVGTPMMSPGSGAYPRTTALPVVLTSATAGAVIHYTTNGADPTQADPSVMSGQSASVGTSLTLKAKAWSGTLPPSNVASEIYTLVVLAPTFTNPAPGISTQTSTPTVSSGTSGATIHYTIDEPTGRAPTETDPQIASGGTLNVDMSRTFRANAWKPGWITSAMTTAIYTLKVPAPTLNPGGGTYSTAKQVTVTASNATIHYTLNGAVPKESDPVIASGATVLVDRTAVLKAVAFRTGWSPSDPASGLYTLAFGTVATPTFSPPAGTYTAAQTVTVSTATAAAVIRYTTDGTDPTLFSPAVTGPLQVDSVVTLRVRAFKGDWTASAIAAGAYTINLGTTHAPTLTPPTGRYPSLVRVTITSATPAATIRYTTDGRDPTDTDPTVVSGGTVELTRSGTLKARAWSGGLPVSGVRRADYVVTGAVAGGLYHSYALKGDGTVLSWGLNQQGALGDPSAGGSRSIPGPVSTLTEAIAVAAGPTHGVALRRNGRVWTWGGNNQGQLGITGGDQLSPVEVPVFGSPSVPVVAIAAGDNHSMALKADGFVWKWGQGTSTPAQVAGLAGITRISAGAVHWMALRTEGGASGTVYAWGTNTDGQIGNGTTTTQNTPLPGVWNVIDISAGGNHSLAAHADGSISAWGGNARGQLGDGTTSVRKEYPVTVLGLGGVVAVAASETASYPFSVALKGDGSIWSWGNNWYGQVGARGTPSQDSVPQPVYTHPFDGGLGIAAGGAHGLANRYDGQIWGWGSNGWGQVGDNSQGVDRFWPVPVNGPFAVDNQWLTGDADGDGLASWAESANGTDALNPDSNGDGLLDGAAVKSGHSATNSDMDADGMTNTAEVAAGTDPFLADTDGDGVSDGADAFPLDPTRSQAPPPVPGDVTPPTITLTEPTNAVLISSVP